jgi:lipid A biosynthesis lauroyl/palmitoleoyl acyltransferase
MKISIHLPYKFQIELGKVLGKFLFYVASSRRKIAEKNLSLCFPDKNKLQINFLLKKNFEEIGISFFETANAYFATNQKIKEKLIVKNEKYLQEAIDNDKSIILLASHFLSLMLGSRALLLKYGIANIYRPQNNQLFDEIMRSSFVKNGAVMIKTKDTRSMLKAIKSKTPIWYAPDQDLGPNNSIYAPFFNIQTATVSATSRLAQSDNTVVLPYHFNRQGNKYIMEFQRPLKPYPTMNPLKDASKTNSILEKQILKFPDQYLWVHKRFKTRPDGESDYYKNL